MGKRRRHFFVLLFVFGLVIASGLVIANKETSAWISRAASS